jgi:predicted ATPase/Tfp pilus assembly protein PilF
VRQLPRGTVTFLFTDIEGSTRLLHELGGGYAEALGEHRRALREAFARHGGVEVDTQGDAFFYAFADAQEAVAAAAEGQAALDGGPIPVRMGLHTGLPEPTDEGYVGVDVHLGARVAGAGHGRQVLISAATRELVDADVINLGEHRLKDFDEAVAIYQLGPASFPPLKTISNTNLPRPASAFVGREHERTEVVSLVRDGARLLTLTGPGGSGKTRLAIEAAAELVPEMKAGVFWVGLAPLRDPELVLETIAQTLGAKDGLAELVGERELLLLLDNLEQVVEAAPKLAQLVEACPNVRLLVTSRELLRVRGEVEYAVLPLAKPEAVELFCSRAGVDADEVVEELCRRLDDLPLAIELAAARAKVLSPRQLLDHLSERLDLLRGGRDAEARQQTLRAAIAWSHDLLDENERDLFARLAVFAGGCTLGAAEAVCDARLDTLQSLVDKSLVRWTEERFWMLETIREYALERVDGLGETTELRRRHVSHFLALAEAEEPRLRGLDEVASVRRLRLELANFRLALGTAISGADAETALRLAGALHPYWYLEGHFVEGRTWAERALALGGTPAQRQKALGAAAEFALMQGATQEAKRHLEERLEICAGLGDTGLLAPAHTLLGHAATVEGDFALALGFYEQALVFEEQAGDNTTVWRSRASALNNVGFALLHLDRLEDAERTLTEAVRAAEEEGTVFVQSAALNNLARVALARRDVNLLRRHLLASLDSQDEPNPHLLTEALELIARLGCLEHRWATAARAVGGAERLRQRLGLGDHVEEIPGRDELATARAKTGDAAWELEVARGRAAVEENALQFARDCLD